MAIGTGIVCDHDGFCILGEHSNLFGSCKSYAFLVVVDLFDKALETCADIVCRVSASLHPGKWSLLFLVIVLDCTSVFVMWILLC